MSFPSQVGSDLLGRSTRLDFFNMDLFPKPLLLGPRSLLPFQSPGLTLASSIMVSRGRHEHWVVFKARREFPTWRLA